MVLRQPQVEAAVLETARGGMLRRGIAVQRANVAVVTNVSDDHFGEYGIHDLDGLAAVKLTVSRVLGNDGALVLNADDGVLVRQADGLPVPLAWFALDDAHPLLRAQREQGGSTCGVREGNLRLFHQGCHHDLGSIVQMPLSFAGSAGYNISNIAAATLALLNWASLLRRLRPCSHALARRMPTTRVACNIGDTAQCRYSSITRIIRKGCAGCCR